MFSLISAYFIEYILGHQPCNLCLIERIPYMIALIIITINFKFNHLERYLILLLVFVFLTSTLISLYHLGIEQGFIKESLVCDLKNSSKILSKEEILQQLQVYTFTLFELVEFCFSESNKRLLLDTVVDFTLSEKVAFSHPLLGHFIFCTIITFYFMFTINMKKLFTFICV